MQAATLKATVFSASLQQRARLGRPQQRALVVRATAGKEEPSLHEKLAGPAAALLGAALLFAATPDEALAARSGGRVGGSSGFSSRAATRAAAPSRASASSRAPAPSRALAPRSVPSTAPLRTSSPSAAPLFWPAPSYSAAPAIQNNYVAPPTAAPTVQNNYIVSSPPVFGGFGMPFFGGGFGFGFYPVFGVGLGTIFNILLLGIVIQVVISVVSGFTNQKKKNDFNDEDW